MNVTNYVRRFNMFPSIPYVVRQGVPVGRGSIL